MSHACHHYLHHFQALLVFDVIGSFSSHYLRDPGLPSATGSHQACSFLSWGIHLLLDQAWPPASSANSTITRPSTPNQEVCLLIVQSDCILAPLKPITACFKAFELLKQVRTTAATGKPPPAKNTLSHLEQETTQWSRKDAKSRKRCYFSLSSTHAPHHPNHTALFPVPSKPGGQHGSYCSPGDSAAVEHLPHPIINHNVVSTSASKAAVRSRLS